VLLLMMLVNRSLSSLRRFTDQPIGFFTTAEVFVFVSALLAGSRENRAKGIGTKSDRRVGVKAIYKNVMRSAQQKELTAVTYKMLPAAFAAVAIASLGITRSAVAQQTPLPPQLPAPNQQAGPPQPPLPGNAFQASNIRGTVAQYMLPYLVDLG
jgi:OpgC protein